MARVENDSSDNDENEDKIIEEDEQELLDGDKDDSDDESITSEEEVDMSGIEDKISKLEEKILDNPYDYKSHIDQLSLLGQVGMRSRLRSAYERLIDIYPLEASQWLSWLQMEGDSVTTPEGKEKINTLFQKAFQDCFCGEIYLEWCTMSVCNEDEARKVLPQALETAGADPLDGSLLWDAAKEFELNQLALISNLSPDSEEYKTQVERIMSIYTNQLSRPLFRVEGIMEEFKEFVASKRDSIVDVDDRVVKIEESYAASEDILKTLMEFEYQLESLVGNTEEKIHERCAVYSKYIECVRQMIKNLNRANLHNLDSLVNVLYNRATSDCSAALCRMLPELTTDVKDICADYVDFAVANNSLADCMKVIERVIRRCPRSSALWVRKMRHLERMETELDKIKSAFESSLYSGFPTADDHVSIWTCYLEILKRKTDFNSEEQIDRLRKTFRLAWDTLGQVWGDTADTEFSILQYWARLEYHHVKDYTYGRELFEEILGYPENRIRGGLWLEYISLERISGGVARARTCYKRAVKNSPDPRIQRSWLSMERDHGTLDTLTECEAICGEKAKEWQIEQQAIKESKATSFQKNYKNSGKKQANERNGTAAAGSSQQGTAARKNKGKKPVNSAPSHSGDQHKGQKGKKYNSDKTSRDMSKRKLDSPGESCASPAKVSRNVEDVTMKDVSVGGKRKIEAEESPTKRLKSETNKGDVIMGPPPGYEKAATRLGAATDPMDDDKERTDRTVFISNLDYLVEEEEVKKKLDSYGEVEELRWAKGPYGRICYCVYKEISSHDMALSRDRSPVGNRPMFISSYNPTKEKRKTHFTYSTSIERNKLFVKNISFDCCTKEKLTEVFEKYGSLKDIRIVTYKTGNPKGLAYIEYLDEKSAATALQATDGLEVGGRALSVALSAPPSKKQESLPGTTAPAPPSTSRGHSKTMLFVPSSVKQNMLQKASNNVKEDSVSDKPTKLSNTDFRNMLLNKK